MPLTRSTRRRGAARPPTGATASAPDGAPVHRPQLLGILNVNADSFSDPHGDRDTAGSIAAGIALRDVGADLVDVGAESASPATPVLAAEAEIAALVPVLEGLHAAGVRTSVDTYKPTVAHAAIDAGVAVVNDYSGLAHPELAEVCGAADVDYVLTHNPAQVKNKLLDTTRYGDVVADTTRWFATTLDELERRGLPRDRVVLDPGIDLSKTPAQSIEVLRGLPQLAADLGRPLLVAISRKDFIGALVPTRPRERGPGTLAALAALTEVPATIARVHDVAAAAQFLAVLDALAGPTPPDADLALDPRLRREPSGPSEGS
ncbi:dihydropteroate synthase [Nitriliruptoraceae bacterium ZYF776]|nr:dihydropteroate synthase [Profundirhabdus halotolerans]